MAVAYKKGARMVILLVIVTVTTLLTWYKYGTYLSIYHHRLMPTLNQSEPTFVTPHMRNVTTNIRGCDVKATWKAIIKKGRCIDCVQLFKGNEQEMLRAINTSRFSNDTYVNPFVYRHMTNDCNCSYFRNQMGYNILKFSPEESDFPLAYSVVMYRDVQQTERLLRTIYRPHNLYCIHVDQKTLTDIYLAMVAIADCFDNVFVTSERVSVIWGGMSVIQAELACMRELWERDKTWKYFINLTGQEFPLKTNKELVKILKAINGTNMILNKNDVFKHRLEHAGPPPHNITVSRGPLHMAVTRGFVEYVLYDQRAKDILSWVQNTTIPDETFFVSLNYNPKLGAPGAIDLSGVNQSLMERIRFKQFSKRCPGRRVRGICILGVRHLSLLASSSALFANKFHSDYEPVALDCLEELLRNRTIYEYS